MNLVQRAQSILLRPRETWPAIAAETTDAATLYASYVAPLAAIPAVARFIGFSLIGIGGFGVSLRVPILTGLVNLVVGYVLSLVVVYVLALIVDALAPTFGGTRSRIAALKVVAYASTAGFVGGIFALVPALGVLSLLASLYGIYLLYTGLPVLMRCPREKAAGYTALVIVCAVVAFFLIGAILSAITPMGMGGRGLAAVAPRSAAQEPQVEGAKRVVAALDVGTIEALKRGAQP
ncbi:MAG TPA: Yip1 family protein [Caldimonas sp.]|nr:Yip1 family protein [Caldimonas sp.]